MTQTTYHSGPRPSDVLAAQIRAVGLALRGPALIATALVALTTLLITTQVMGAGEVIDFHPERHALPGLLGLLFPIGVWMGEERFGAGFLWALPVDRRRHALARVFAGWVWLMGAVALLALWLLALALFSGGNVLAEETHRVLPSFSIAATGPFHPSAVQDARWTPKPLLWLVPFTAATGTYLLASALALGTRRTLRWIVGTVFGFFLLVALAEAANADRLITNVDRLLRWLVDGPYGVDALLTARTESLQVAVTLSTGESVVVWRALPDLCQWATATLLWIGAGLALLWAAASRHRERRRT
jgi:hypothetical protein